jgi:transposase-like protein
LQAVKSEVIMRINFKKEPKIKLKYPLQEKLLAAVYPRMYCPRCGSKEIGLKMLTQSEAIWDCRECGADFRLLFPASARF